jgi:hypothetical protein
LISLWLNYKLEDVVSPAGTTPSAVIMFTSHIAFTIWSFSVFAHGVSGPTFASVLHTNILISSLHGKLETFLWISIASSEQVRKIPVTRILVTTL